MRRVLLIALFFVWAPAAHADTSVSIEATTFLGQAPFEARLSAVGPGDSFAWDFGDGTTAAGRVVSHRYDPGRFTATVTSSFAGQTAQASVTIISASLLLTGPRIGTYGHRARLSGRTVPALPGAKVALYTGDVVVAIARAGTSGRFRFHPRLGHAAPFEARFGAVVSNAVEPAIRPRLNVSLPRARLVGRRLELRAHIQPADAGAIEVRLWRNGRRLRSRQLGSNGAVRLPTSSAGEFVVQLVIQPADGFARVVRTLRTTVALPFLRPGSRGPSVRSLERRLAELHYALRNVDGLYAHDTYEAVLAFQKVNGLRRMGWVSPALWRRLHRAGVPRARYRGSHIEVDKRRQVLFDVRHGRVARVVHVSTGATGNTPVGRWRIYRKVGGWDWVLWYPMYFIGGFAVHGYPSVPAYPASHGCVRVPMWIAPKLFAANPYGQTVYVY